MNEQQNHPLHGVGLEAMLGELVRCYGWEILGEQINVNCFKSYPSFESSMKYLRKTVWAREKIEAFYLYKFLQHPRPDDVQHRLPPRIRAVDLQRIESKPAAVLLGDGEFFDDPLSGPVFPSRKSVEKSRSNSKPARKELASKAQADQPAPVLNNDEPAPIVKSDVPKSGSQESASSKPKADPWAKWSKKSDN